MATFSEGVMTFSGAIQHKRGTSAALAASNYVPAAGEIVIATDTGEMRSGDGTNTWTNLPSYDGTEIANNLTTTTTGKALPTCPWMRQVLGPPQGRSLLALH